MGGAGCIAVAAAAEYAVAEQTAAAHTVAEHTAAEHTAAAHTVAVQTAAERIVVIAVVVVFARIAVAVVVAVKIVVVAQSVVVHLLESRDWSLVAAMVPDFVAIVIGFRSWWFLESKKMVGLSGSLYQFQSSTLWNLKSMPSMACRA